MEKVEVIKNFLQEVWRNRNSQIIDEVFVPDYEKDKTAEGLSKDEKLGPAEFKAYQSAMLELVEYFDIDIKSFMEDGDWIAVQCEVSGPSRQSGNKVKMSGCAWARVTDGKIREAQNYFDFLNFFEELGLLPKDTMKACIEGRGIVPSNLVT